MSRAIRFIARQVRTVLLKLEYQYNVKEFLSRVPPYIYIYIYACVPGYYKSHKNIRSHTQPTQLDYKRRAISKVRQLFARSVRASLECLEMIFNSLYTVSEYIYHLADLITDLRQDRLNYEKITYRENEREREISYEEYLFLC